MKTRVAFTLLALLGIVSLGLLPVSGMFAPTSVEQALKTSRVELPENGSGSCFPIADQAGFVAFLTCGHVIEATPVAVQLPSGERVPVVSTARHPSRDVGVIWVRCDPIAPVPLAYADAKLGESVLIAGYPAMLGLWLSQGLVGSPDTDDDVWASAPIYYGCSGGPVLVDGRLVGVAMGVLVDHNRMQVVSTISVMVPVGSFRDWLREEIARGPVVK